MTKTQSYIKCDTELKILNNGIKALQYRSSLQSGANTVLLKELLEAPTASCRGWEPLSMASSSHPPTLWSPEDSPGQSWLSQPAYWLFFCPSQCIQLPAEETTPLCHRMPWPHMEMYIEMFQLNVVGCVQTK